MANNLMIITGDCMEYLPMYEDNHFKLIITDPPYGLFSGKTSIGEIMQERLENIL